MRTNTDEVPQATAQQAGFLKALSHPLRLRILHEMNRGLTSPKELADELGESLGVISYHVRTLEELGCIELADTKFRRGAVQHFYRPLRRAESTDDVWEVIPQNIRSSLSATAIQTIVGLVSGAMRAETFDERTDRHVSVAELELDEEGWQEINQMCLDVVERARELHAEAAAPDRADEPKVATALALMHFPRAAGA